MKIDEPKTPFERGSIPDDNDDNEGLCSFRPLFCYRKEKCVNVCSSHHITLAMVISIKNVFRSLLRLKLH